MERPAVLYYKNIPHHLYENKEKYEQILIECINKSNKMISRLGGKLEEIIIQSNKECDAKVVSSDYTLDFKLFVSKTYKEFKNITKNQKQEIAKGVYVWTEGKKAKNNEAVLLYAACRDLNEVILDNMRLNRRDKLNKEVGHFFDEVINVNKNILLFFPMCFFANDNELSGEEKDVLIRKEIGNAQRYIYEYRKKYFCAYDNFVIYITKICGQREYEFNITEFKEEGLICIDKIPMHSLKTVCKSEDDNIGG